MKTQPKAATESGKVTQMENISESGLPAKPDRASIARQLDAHLKSTGLRNATGQSGAMKGYELIGVERSQPSPEKPGSVSLDPAAKPYQPFPDNMEDLKKLSALHGIHLGPEDEPFMQELLSLHKPTKTEKP